MKQKNSHPIPSHLTKVVRKNRDERKKEHPINEDGKPGSMPYKKLKSFKSFLEDQFDDEGDDDLEYED